MSKYLRKEKTKVCPIHKAVYAKCCEYLEERGFFSKDEVLEDLQFETVEDSIRWDYVREFIRDEQHCDVVPLAAAFFKRHKVAELEHMPEKFIAQGHGKKTAGYASLREETAGLFVHRIAQQKAFSDGVAKAFDKYLLEIKAKRIINKKNLVQLGLKKAAFE